MRLAPLLALAVLLSCAAPANPSAARPAAPPPSSADTPAQAGGAPAAPGPTAERAATAPAPVMVRAGMIGSISDAGILLGIERGMFQDEGIEAVVERFDTGPAQITQLAAGNLEVASPTADPGTFNAVVRGIPLRIVADKGSARPGFGFNAILLRKDLADSGAVRDERDVRGRTFANLARGTVGEPNIHRLLERGGLTPDDVNLQYMPFPDMNRALANQAIDLASSIEPFLTLALTQGVAVRFRGADEISPGQQVAVLTYGPRFVAENPDAGRRFMAAYLRAVRLYNDAFAKHTPGVRDEMVQILIKHTPVKDAALYDRMVYPYLNPNGHVNLDSIKADFEWFRARGYIEGRIDVDSVIDHSFADHAVGRLGRYE
jgi:NitT/TauT family transport system substrate-binding protein